MKLIVQEETPALFPTGEVLEDVQFVPGIWRPGLLVIQLAPGYRRFITIAQAKKDNLHVVEATEEELHQLVGAGYSMPVDLQPAKPAKPTGSTRKRT